MGDGGAGLLSDMRGGEVDMPASVSENRVIVWMWASCLRVTGSCLHDRADRYMIYNYPAAFSGKHEHVGDPAFFEQ